MKDECVRSNSSVIGLQHRDNPKVLERRPVIGLASKAGDPSGQSENSTSRSIDVLNLMTMH